jgi:Ser/Thr protein kinase RdoA (MazF antagonist)
MEHLTSSLFAHVRDLEDRLGSLAVLPELVIHGDYYAENLIMRDNEVVGLIDYDQAHWCSRVLEVAEALIYFAREPEERLKHIVYPAALDLDVTRRFLAAYGAVVYLSDAELYALPHLVRTIWMCAALDPPLKPRTSVQSAPQVLPEVLYLADWARDHAPELTEMGMATRRSC